MADYKSGYSNKPLWQWLLIYVVIGGIIYAAVYFIFFKGGYNFSASQNSMPQQSHQAQPRGY